MSCNSGFKGSGKNDVWFALFFIAVVVIAGLVPRHQDATRSDRPAPLPAAQIKD